MPTCRVSRDRSGKEHLTAEESLKRSFHRRTGPAAPVCILFASAPGAGSHSGDDHSPDALSDGLAVGGKKIAFGVSPWDWRAAGF